MTARGSVGASMPEREALFYVVPPTAPEIPVVVEVPHAGTFVPADALANLVVSASNLARDADLFVDQLYTDAPSLGATLVASRTSRYFVDLNRAESDVDDDAIEPSPSARAGGGPPARAARGIVWRLSGDGSKVLRRPITTRELEARLDALYRPYHQAVAEALAAKTKRFGYAILLAAHSMPSEGRGDPRSPSPAQVRARADVVPGTRGRTSAAPRFIAAVDAHAASARLSVSHDDPYKGGYSTQHYGRPSTNVHAVQVELARRLYMDEVTCSMQPEAFGKLRIWCAGLVTALAKA